MAGGAMRLVLSLGCALLVACIGACARPGNEQYVPSAAAAAAAVEAAMSAWQDGRPPGKIDGQVPELMLVDSHRKPGQSVKGYEVLGETAGDGPRCLAVKVELEGPAEELRVRFVVVGLDPLWVFRYEDYEMMAHWDHPMK